MQETKYYDYENERPLNLDSDGCALADWGKCYGKARYARHPKGFRIFLPPEKLASSDEYVDSDPYTVEQNIDNEFHRRRIDLTIELLIEAVSNKKRQTILDIGCGQGHITHEMYIALGSAEFTGLDYSVSAIEYAHEHFSNIDFAVGDAYECPYSKAYFDVVVCNNIWEHVPDPLYLLSKIDNLLKPGGYLIVSTPSRYRFDNLVRILMGKPVTFMSSHHVTEYSVGQVIQQLAHGGFQVNRILSRPILMESLKAKLVYRLFALFILAVGSHHQLESTVFYLAKNQQT